MGYIDNVSVPSKVQIGWEQRDTGTINIIFPPQFISLRICLEGSKYDGPVHILNDFPVIIEQNGTQHQIGRIEPNDSNYDWWNSKHGDLSDNEPDCDTTAERTDDDSSRIIGQVNEQNNWELRGIGPGQSEWVIKDENGNEVARSPLELTGGPPLLDDVIVSSVDPVTDGQSITVNFSVSNPVGVGVTMEVEITIVNDNTGLQIFSDTKTITATGTVNIGEPNISKFSTSPIDLSGSLGLQPGETENITCCVERVQ